MKLISGLGNPTRRYGHTRHNVGFLAIDRIAENLYIRLKPSSRSLIPSSSKIGRGEFHGEKIILLKPLTYMNLSGKAIGSLAKAEGINSEEIIVICDDINLDLGRIRIRKSGASGGHNGLKSIIENLGTDKFPRLRIGIGKAEEEKSLSEYVLEKFSRRELILIKDRILDVVSEAVVVYLEDGIEAAMSRFNDTEIS